MTQDFERFVDLLSDEDRGRLYGAVPFLTALVARADGKLSLREKLRRWRAFLETKTEIAESFVNENASKEVNQYLDRLSEESKTLSLEEAQDHIVTELRKLGAIINQMPDTIRERFEAFVLASCLGVAEASGRILWSGEEISKEERSMLKLIVREVKLSIPDQKARALLELD
jgi:hypothetical protein